MKDIRGNRERRNTFIENCRTPFFNKGERRNTDNAKVFSFFPTSVYGTTTYRGGRERDTIHIRPNGFCRRLFQLIAVEKIFQREALAASLKDNLTLKLIPYNKNKLL